MKNIYITVSIILIFILGCENINMDNPNTLDETPPLIHITYPANQSTLSGTVLITAYAYDENKLENVKLYLDDAIIFQSDTGPYQFNWNTLMYEEDQNYILNATAEDSSGNKTFSKSIQVKIDNFDNIKPVGVFLYPSMGQVLNGVVEISIQAEDNDGVDYINLFINGDSLGVFTEQQNINDYYNYFWDTNNMPEDNISSIYAYIYDYSKNYQVMGPISVTINNQDAPDITYPQGTIVTPASGSTVNGVVNIEVNVFDNIGISKVNFFINGDSLFCDTIPPYKYDWDTTLENENQNHTINIDVIDLSGNQTSLYPISVYVNNFEEPDLIPPNIVIYEPAANQTVFGEVDVLTIATDNDSVFKVEFYQNYELVGTDFSASYKYSWDTLTEEDDTDHIWFAIAYDFQSNSSQSDPIVFKVDNLDGIPPNGIITYPYAGQSVSDIITIQAEASDNVGVDNIQFLINDSIVFIDDGTPFEYSWNTLNYLEDQQHQLTIIISDFNNNSFETGLFVTINNNPIPEDDTIYPFVSILNPISGQTVSDTVSVTGFATDNYQIAQVQFFLNNEIVSTLNDTPYTFLWNTLELLNNSEHLLTMTAEDQSGNITTAQPVLVVISNP